MKSLLIATFTSERSARSAMKRLDELALNGDIDLFERTMIRRTADGRCKVFRGDVSAGWQTLAGAGLGSLIGLVGGPVGSVIGLFSGSVIGSAVAGREQYDFGKEIVEGIEARIPPGKWAIVAQVGERHTELIDSLLKHFDADIFREHTSPGNGGKYKQVI